MSTITFDTLKFVEQLEKAGMPREQAAAIAQAQRDSLAESLDTATASKTDMVRLEGRLNLLQWMLGFVIAMQVAMLWKLFGG